MRARLRRSGKTDEESKVHLMVLKFPSNDTECYVRHVLVNVDFGQAGRGSARNPFLQVVVVDHNARPSGRYTLFAVTKDDKIIFSNLRIRS